MCHVPEEARERHLALVPQLLELADDRLRHGADEADERRRTLRRMPSEGEDRNLPEVESTPRSLNALQVAQVCWTVGSVDMHRLRTSGPHHWLGEAHRQQFMGRSVKA